MGSIPGYSRAGGWLGRQPQFYKYLEFFHVLVRTWIDREDQRCPSAGQDDIT